MIYIKKFQSFSIIMTHIKALFTLFHIVSSSQTFMSFLALVLLITPGLFHSVTYEQLLKTSRTQQSCLLAGQLPKPDSSNSFAFWGKEKLRFQAFRSACQPENCECLKYFLCHLFFLSKLTKHSRQYSIRRYSRGSYVLSTLDQPGACSHSKSSCHGRQTQQEPNAFLK